MPLSIRPYYGWYIAVVAFFANFMATGSGFYVLNAFLEPLCELRGWSRTDINLALTLGTLFGFAGQFAYGTLVVWLGPRILMTVGALGAGVAFIFLFRMESLPAFYLLYILLFLFNGAYGGIVANTAASNWFVQNRGKAMGFTTAGMSLSGAVLPFAAMIIILKAGISGASLAIGLAILILSPIAWAIVRDWPEGCGLAPDGATASAVPATASAVPLIPPVVGLDGAAPVPDSPWRLSSLVRTGAFWKIGLAYGFMMIGVVGVMSQLKPRFSDIGFSPMDAMGLMALTALFGAAGKYILGALCDRFVATRVSAVMAGCIGAGLGFGLLAPSAWTLAVFVAVFGFFMGGVMSTFPVIVADRFGRRAFPVVFRYLYLFLALQMAGYLISGISYDRFGSYDLAYGIYIGLDILAFFLLAAVKPAARVA